MATDDKGNYGTPISYATQQEDNEITFTDPFGFVLSVKGMQLINIICFEIDNISNYLVFEIGYIIPITLHPLIYMYNTQS